MATCAVIGQAVGTAAAQCVAAGISPRELAHDGKQVARLQQALLRDDQTIKGRVNQDPDDLARTATVTASSEEGAAMAALVLDGTTRDIPDGEAHHWAAALPAWIELTWPQAQRIRQVQITFDSGFQRQLTLSAQEAQNVNLLRAPQQETVRDYRVTAGPRTLAEEKGNFQRINRHRFEAVETKSRASGDPGHQWRSAGQNLRNPLLRMRVRHKAQREK